MTNLEKYLSLLDAGKYDGLLLTSAMSRKYCAEFNVDEGVAIVTKKGCRYYTDSRYIETAEKNLKGFEVMMVSKNNGYVKLLNEAIADFGVTTLGFEEAYLTVAEFRSYEEKLNAKLVPCQQDINAFRVVKEEYELQRMREAQDITDRAFTEVCTRIREGMTEKELAAELIYCMYKNGADDLSFKPIVVSGPNTSMPHGVPGERKLRKGDFITMDFGVIYKDYCSDMTRTVALGYATDEMKTGDCFGHGYGHCLGMEVHEAPYCNPSNDKPMPAGCVSSAEPGIYIPGKFGVRIEDCVIIKEDGVEDLAHSPKDLIIIEA